MYVYKCKIYITGTTLSCVFEHFNIKFKIFNVIKIEMHPFP